MFAWAIGVFELDRRTLEQATSCSMTLARFCNILGGFEAGSWARHVLAAAGESRLSGSLAGRLE
jgi:hypothetical protein